MKYRRYWQYVHNIVSGTQYYTEETIQIYNFVKYTDITIEFAHYFIMRNKSTTSSFENRYIYLKL